jgi:hypothetical protein
MLWGALGFYVQITTTMLIGFLIGRNGWVRRIPELMPWVKRVQWWALGVGGVCTLIFGILGQLDHPPAPSLRSRGGHPLFAPAVGMSVLYPNHIAGRPGAVMARNRGPMAAASG